MHTVLVISGGLVLLALFVIGARLAGRKFKPLLTTYLVLWFIGAGTNMAVGVYHAGYSFMDELPIFLLVFGLPAVIAIGLSRKL